MLTDLLIFSDQHTSTSLGNSKVFQCNYVITNMNLFSYYYSICLLKI